MGYRGFKLGKSTLVESEFLTSSLPMGTLEMPVETINRDGFREIQLEVFRYAQNPKALAIQAYTMTRYGENTFPEPYGRLSVNVDGLRLEPWEVAIKDWSENKELASLAFSSRFFLPSTRYDLQEGVTIASINPAALPIKTLYECSRHFRWEITPIQLIEALARDCQSRGDGGNINLVVNSGNRNILINPLFQGGLEMIQVNDKDQQYIILDFHDALFAEDDLIKGDFSLYVNSHLLFMGHSDLKIEDYKMLIINALDIYNLNYFKQENNKSKINYLNNFN